jgi:Ca2+-binding RTX toxin-like protein
MPSRTHPFFGISSPYLSNNRHRDLFNLGVQNDLVYGVVPGSWNEGSKEAATEHIYFYLKHRFMTGNLEDNIHAHDVGAFNRAMLSLVGLTVESGEQLVDVLKPDSYLVFDQFKGTVQASKVGLPKDKVLTIVGESRDDRIAGTNGGVRGDSERVYGLGGDDVIRAKHGRDEIYGGTGDDTLDGGLGRDWMSGGDGNDRIVFETHLDAGEGGAGKDRFIVKTVTNSGPSPAEIIIADFTPGQDTLVLNAFDGNRERKGIQPLHFVEYAVYDANDGLSPLEQGFVNNNDLRPGGVTIYQDENGDTFLIINRDHDRGREFEIKFDGSLGDFSADLMF